MKSTLLVLALPLLLTGCAGVGVDVGGPGYPGYYEGNYYGGPAFVSYSSYNRGYYHHGYHHYTSRSRATVSSGHRGAHRR
jgi:hypothetical protein